MYFAKSTIILTALLESQNEAFLDKLFPSTVNAYDFDTAVLDFMYAVVGQRDQNCHSSGDPYACPVFACGDTLVSDYDVVDVYSGVYPEKAFFPGTIDGEAIPGEGCGPPFIRGYIMGENTTETGEEALGASISLSLKLFDNGNPVDFYLPPMIGPFEDYIGSVCPHSALKAADFLGLVYGKIKKEAEPSGTIDEDVHALCTSNDYDVTSGKLFVGGAEVWHFDSNVLYMPSDFEVAAWTLFIGSLTTYNVDLLRLLLMMKLRYSDTAAGGSARSGIDVLNTHTSLAADCGVNPDSFSLTSHNAWATNVEELEAAASVEDVCQFMAIIELITDWCQEALQKEIMSGYKGSCEETYKMVAQKTKTACGGASCGQEIMSGFLCTAVESSVGEGSCSSMDVMAYYLSDYGNACDPWSSMMGYCGDVGSLGFYSASGGVYGAFLGTYSSFGNYFGGWYGNSWTYGTYQYSSYYYGGYNYRRLNVRTASKRLLTHEDSFSSVCIGEDDKMIGSEDSAKCLTAVPFVTSSFTPPDGFTNAIGDYNFLSFPGSGVVADLKCGSETGEANAEACEQFGAAMINSLKKAVTHDKVTIVTSILDDLLGHFDPSVGNLTLPPTAAQIRKMVGEFLTTTYKIYMDADGDCVSAATDANGGPCAHALVPIFPACDPEFEESLVRDSIEIKWGPESEARCTTAPFSFPGTLKGTQKRLQRMRAVKAATGPRNPFGVGSSAASVR